MPELTARPAHPSDLPRREAFAGYLEREAPEGSNRAPSYIRALDLLGEMIARVPMGFEDCANIWAVEDLGLLSALLDQVREEKQKGDASRWNLEGLPSELPMPERLAQ
jgi:hypothetical protein